MESTTMLSPASPSSQPFYMAMSSDEEKDEGVGPLSSPFTTPDHLSSPSSPLSTVSLLERQFEELPSSPSQVNSADDNEPPYSRVFIVCGKNVSEDQLCGSFGKYGKIESCKLLFDKATKESKGVAYIKFDKASSAALAIENLHGKQICDNTTALKVVIAEIKGTKNTKPAYTEPDDLPPRSRLFVVCSKDITEDELANQFKVFGDMVYCKLVRDKLTSESKGCAYVKYSRASTAALAMESINEQNTTTETKMKVLIADPKNTSKRQTEIPLPMPTDNVLPLSYGPPLRYIPYITPFDFAGTMLPNYAYMHPMMVPAYMPMPPKQRLFVVCHKSVTQEQLLRLFSHWVGLEYCDLKKTQTGESKGFAYVNYSTPQAAFAAKEQLDGSEFPPGCLLKVMFAEPKVDKSKTDITAVSNSFAQLMQPSHDINERNFPEGSRLFIVVTGKPVTEYLLHSVFVQFPGLEYVKMQKDKNFGFVKYTSAFAAQYAMNYLNGADIQGAKLKVQIANPPNAHTTDTSRKRQKT